MANASLGGTSSLSPVANRAFYPSIPRDEEARGINGPMFTRLRCGGSNRNGPIFRSLDSCRPRPHTTPEDNFSRWAEQSIYDLIPKPVFVPEKEPMYRSKYPGNNPPSASTFLLATTSRVGVQNLEGDMKPQEATGTGQHEFRNSTGTFGASHVPTPDPEAYLKKHDRSLPKASRFHYSDEDSRRAYVPRRADATAPPVPVQKDFITTNAVDVILAAPKKRTDKGVDYLRKSDYGQIPTYLQRVKETVNGEVTRMRDMEEAKRLAEDRRHWMVPESEKRQLIDGLRSKWDEVNKEYQLLTLSLFNLDTVGKVNRKEHYEAMLSQIQRDIEKLSKPYVFVEAY